MKLPHHTRAARLARPAALAAALAIASSAAAQQAQDECSARLDRARSQYQAQQFAEVERLIASCVDRQELRATDMEDGFRLLTLAYLRENLLAEAQATVIKHLAWSFTYEPDEVRDPPLYVALVRVIKAQLTVPPTALLASTTPAGRAPAPAQEAIADPNPPGPTEQAQAATDPETSGNTQPQTGAAEEQVTQAEDPPAVAEPQAEADDADAGEEEPAPTAVASTPPVSTRPQPVVEPPTSANSQLGRPPADEPEPETASNGVGLEPSDSTEPAGLGRYGGGISSVPDTDPSVLRLPLPQPTERAKVDPYNETLDFATVMPEIIGGADAIRLEYPDFERRTGVQGRVVVRFVVDTDGRVAEAEVLRGVGPGLDRAALNALRQLRFTPARQNGQPARVRMTLTFHFDGSRESAG